MSLPRLLAPSGRFSLALTVDGIIMRNLLFTALVASLFAPAAEAAPTRVKELADVVGVRDNAIVGYGLVVGLSGTGDTERVFFTQQSVSSMLGRLGVRIDPREVRVRNVAAVMVTAKLPAFKRPGSTLDVEVSSMGNARSLTGGVLLMTPLKGPDGQVYAVAQGALQVGGFDARAAGSSIRKNKTGAGRIPGGATVERAVTPDLTKGPVTLALKSPDITTAVRIAKVVNEQVGEGSAKALDPAAVEVTLPEGYEGGTLGLLAALEALEVEPDEKAKIIISERTGTVVAGANVRIRPVAVAHGGLNIAIEQVPVISQPGPFSRAGSTAIANQAALGAQEESRGAVALPATTTVEELVAALNSLGVTPRDLVSILQAMKAAGALDAELQVL